MGWSPLGPAHRKEGDLRVAWQTPKTNWKSADVVSPSDFNRIEGNLQEVWDRFHASNGHQHTGAPGDGPKLDPTKALTYVPVNKAGDTMTNTLEINRGGPALRLKPGTGDHVYLEFYADSDAPNTRSGYIGYPGAGYHDLYIQNEMSGIINLVASDVRANGRSLVTAVTTPLRVLYRINLTLTTPGATGWQKLATVPFDEPFGGQPFVVTQVTSAANVANRLFPNAITTTKFDLWGYVEVPNTVIQWSYLAIGPRP